MVMKTVVSRNVTHLGTRGFNDSLDVVQHLFGLRADAPRLDLSPGVRETIPNTKTRFPLLVQAE